MPFGYSGFWAIKSMHNSIEVYYFTQFCIKIGFRPMKITTEDFGKLWLSFSNDVKQNVKMSPSQGSLSIALNTLQQKLKLHVVDIVGECRWFCMTCKMCQANSVCSQKVYNLSSGTRVSAGNFVQIHLMQ